MLDFQVLKNYVVKELLQQMVCPPDLNIMKRAYMKRATETG